MEQHFADFLQSSNPLSAAQLQELSSTGLLVLPSHPFVLEHLDQFRQRVDGLLEAEGERAGWEGKEQHFAAGKAFEGGVNRLGNLVEKDQLFASLISLPEILAAAHGVVQDDLKIGAVDLREPLKDAGRQQIHIDWYPRSDAAENYAGIVAQIFLDDSTTQNGAMRYFPASHKTLGWPDEHIDVFQIHPDEKRAEVKAGGIVIMNLNLWHGGAINESGSRRRSIFIDIRRRELPQLLNQKLYLTDRTIAKLSPLQLYLLAVRSEDPTQAERSVGPGDLYRKAFGDKRKRFEERILNQEAGS